MGRSKAGPSLRRLAGARLTMTFLVGNLYPLLEIATRTRSRASCTAASGRPTTENPGRPALTSTSTSTGEASMPSNVKLQALQTDIT